MIEICNRNLLVVYERELPVKTKGKNLEEYVKKNDGSITVELCLIFPFVVWTVFFVIYLFIGELNQGVVTGEVYEKLYNREAYVYNDTRQADFEEILRGNMDLMLKETVAFIEDMETSVVFIHSGNSIFHNLEKFSAGNLQVSVSYKEEYPGISNMIKDTDVGKMIMGNQEIRDTSNNLRRWQLYGKVLSD